MRFRFGDGWVEGIPGEKDQKVIDSYLIPNATVPVKPKLSATVMLLRDSRSGSIPNRIEDGQFPKDFPTEQNVEVFMYRRVKTMAFVPDAVVFPGGGVDPRDANPDLPWYGPTPKEWAGFMGCSEDDARQVLVAAAREVFEECGVLLAGHDGQTTVRYAGQPEWKAARKALAHHEISFAEVLLEHGLMLRTDLLGLVSELQTPAGEPRRYDTYFFSARMPEGQQADGDTSEAQVAGWTTPAYAVRASDEGRWRIVPPTLMNLTYLATAKDVESFVTARRVVNRCTLHVEYVDNNSEQPLLRWSKGDRLVGNRDDYTEDGSYHPRAATGFIKDDKAWSGGWVHSRICCLIADNASPMTYTGTNTWIVLGPSPAWSAMTPIGSTLDQTRWCLAVDPGPTAHDNEILRWIADHGLKLGAVVTTHRHGDHAEGAPELARKAGVPWLRTADGSLPLGVVSHETYPDIWPQGMPGLEIVATPGHTEDSIALVVQDTMCALTGDAIFSQGPTLIKQPGGDLGEYLDTLDTLQELVRIPKTKLFCTGHGYPIRQCTRIINATRNHRLTRLATIRQAIESGVEATPSALVDAVYVGVDPRLREGAEQSVTVQLAYLGFE